MQAMSTEEPKTSKLTILGETAGLFWLAADALWAIGDRRHWENTRLVEVLFGIAFVLGVAFVAGHLRGRGKETK